MGGHGGLNILPQKRWNVYNFDNREKVRKDEEAAAREEQLKREESRRRDSEFRLERLRQARGIEGPAAAAADDPGSAAIPPADSRHINLFEGLQDFSSLTGSSPSEAGREEERKNGKEKRKRDEGGSIRDQKRKREERPAAIAPEDEKYRMGYGLAGKGVKAPWYLSRPSLAEAAEESSDGRESRRGGGHDSKKAVGGKKTIEELRAERLEREKKEKERERALLKSARKR